MTFDWDEEKNALLRRTRGVSLEHIVSAIEDGDVADVLKHPGPDRYPDQRVYLVILQDYVFVVPFVRDDESDRVFLKTVYPSRTFTKRYLRQESEDGT